jgi:hypothetical protein
MADNNEKRTIEIILKAQQANASINEMAAGTRVLTAQLNKMGADDPGRAKLLGDLQGLNKRLTDARAGTRAYTQSQEELAAATEKLNQENIRVVVNGKKVEASFNDIKAAADVLEKELKQLPIGTEAFIAKSKELADVRSRLTDVSAEMGVAEKSTSLLGKGFKSLMVTLLPLFALQNIFSFLTDAKADFESADHAANQMKATLTATGHAAGVTFDEIQKAADELQKKVKIDGDETMGAASLLGTFTKVKKEVFLDSLPLIQDMATKLAGDGPLDLKGATLQVGKALNDPIKGITALARAGVSFTEQQKEQIKTMVKAGDVAGAQKLILNELKNEFGGAAEAAAKTGGGWKGFLLTMEDVREVVGEKVVKVLDLLSNFLGQVMDNSGPLVDLFTGLAAVLRETWNEISGLLQGLGILQEEGSGAKLLVQALTATFTLLLMPLKLLALGIGGVVSGVKSMIAAGQTLAEVGPRAFEAFGQAVRQSLGNVKELLLGLFTFDADRIKQAFANIKAPVAAAVEDFASDFQTRYSEKLALLNPKQAAAQAEAATEAQLRVLENSGAKAAGLTAAEAKKLLKAREAAAKAELELQHAIEDMRLALMLDANAREIEEINLQTNRKMAALKGSDAQIQEQWELLEQQRQDKINAVRQRQRDEEEAQQVADRQKEQDMIAAEEELYLANLEEKVARGLEAEQFYQDQLYNIKKTALERELEELRLNGEAETSQVKRKQAALKKLDTEHFNDKKKQEQGLAKLQAQLAQEGKAVLYDSLNFLLDVLNKKSVAYEAFKNALKLAQIAEIAINLEARLMKIFGNAESDPLSSNMVTAAIPAANAAVKAAVAIGQAAVSTARIMAFADGGRTDKGSTALSMETVMSLFGGGLSGSRSTFAAGGSISQPTIGLIGEAGPELVIPNWLYADPKAANLMGYLEQAIASRGGAFAAGGSTTGASPVASDLADVVGGGRIVELLEALVSSQRAHQEEISTWQRQLEVKMDYRKVADGLDTVKQVRSGGGIRKRSE